MNTLHEQETTVTALPFSKQARQEEPTTTHKYATPPKIAGKRMVSKRRYVVNIGKKVALSSASLGFLMVAVSATMYAGMLVTVFFSPPRPLSEFGLPQDAPPAILGFGLTALLCYFLAWRNLHKVHKVETGVPLTRANTANLPAPESLVRASAEPPQAQEAVLLRATEGQETPPEQLVRAVNGQE